MATTKDKTEPSEATMSLGDHLEELRVRLIKALLGLLVGAIICLCFGTKIIRFIKDPYIDAMKSHQLKLLADPNVLQQSTLFGILFSDLIEALRMDPNAPPLDPNVVQYVQGIYLKTLERVIHETLTQQRRPPIDLTLLPAVLITLGPTDAFMAYMKISLVSGLLLTAPWVFYQIWMFIAAGLHAHERKYVQTAVPFSAALFIFGALFFLFVVAPISLRFFLGFGDVIGVSCSWTFEKYVSFVTLLMLVFGIAFQTPIAIFILNRTGLVSVRALRSSRKYVLLGIFIVAAMATPPDVISQVTLALPLFLLYELGIILCIAVNRKANTESESS